jgi:hypothetical protein
VSCRRWRRRAAWTGVAVFVSILCRAILRWGLLLLHKNTRRSCDTPFLPNTDEYSNKEEKKTLCEQSLAGLDVAVVLHKLGQQLRAKAGSSRWEVSLVL